MITYIHHLETSVPETHYEQPFASELMQNNVSEREGVRRVLRSIYHHSGIRKRHSVIDDFGGSDAPPLFFNKDGSKVPPPDTRRRNEIYTREARRLFTDLAGKLIQNAPGFEKEDITHVITISCTGFFAPGPDYFVVRDLGLPGSTQRYHIGFMGCYAAFQGLKMADSFCRSNPDAVVLVLCVELCTLHLQFTDDTDAMISASVFADGGSGALVSARTPSFYPTGPEASSTRSPLPLEILSFHNDLTPEGENDMAWTIGNQGFEMKLSTYVPDIIRSNMPPILDAILKNAGLHQNDITHWAVHPGGRAILDKVQEALALRDEQISASRTVLREYGNMSSATILFVLKEMVETHAGSSQGRVVQLTAKQPPSGLNMAEENPAGQNIFAMAFGPGLTIESGLFRFTDPM